MEEVAPDARATGPSFLFNAGWRFRHFPQLDGLRGTAVLLVCLGHALVFRLGRSARWTQVASLGVLFFFVLSGFLITGLLCSEERRTRRVSLKYFYVRRAFRILPAFAVYVLTVICLSHFKLITDSSWKTVLVSVLFLKNFFGPGLSALGHLWSLSLEEQFYLFWPLLFAVVGRRRLLAPTMGLILGIALYRGVAILVAPYDYGSGVFELRSDFRMDSILVGCGLALVLDRRPQELMRFSRLACWGTHPLWALPLLFYWTLFCNLEPVWSVYLSVQTVLVGCLVFHLVAFPKSVVGRLLQQRWIRLVGLLSYSLYLWQQPFLVLSTPSWGAARELPWCVLLSGAAAGLSYVLVERPFLQLKRQFSSVR